MNILQYWFAIKLLGIGAIIGIMFKNTKTDYSSWIASFSEKNNSLPKLCLYYY